MKRWWMLGILVLIAVAGTAGICSTATAQQTCDPWISKIVSIQGRVVARSPSDVDWRPVKINEVLCPGDQIQVDAGSRAAVVLSNASVLRIDQNSTLVFSGVEQKKTFLLKLLEGAAHFFSRKPRSLKVTTPFVNGVVKGTEFLVRVSQDRTRISLYEGRLWADNAAGGMLLAEGQSLVARAGQPPRLETIVRPRDAVQWALYYPPILVIEDPAPTRDDPDFYINRAAERLKAGRVDDAGTDIDQALTMAPGRSKALALRSIIAVVQNRKADALADAQKAVDADDQSAAAHIALSYAHQTRFDLDAAARSARAATQAAPDNAIAWSRLAELRLSLGDMDGALTAAKRAAGLDPRIARTQTVLGFAYLTEINIAKAVEAFTKAIGMDTAAPLPRLGLGLAKLRKGRLEDGRADIEIAAGLDPDNAILRSYLGKAYFDEKRGPLDARQFEMAKTLDPADPTPWLYDAIRKQSENRPVEAMQDLQKSIELNNNRAVYRSKLLLDEDLAARSASLGRIYSDLGFSELGLRQGWQSLSADPSNHSAHRLLADLYASRPRHEIARVSELLQSQLLQPVNMTPVQPQLAESDTFIFEGTGPATATFNEFNPLFQRNRLTLQASGVVGGNETIGDEVVLAGIKDNFSFSVGQFYYDTEGFRENNDQIQRLYNGFVQWSLPPKLSLQAELRSKNIDNGDLLMRFDPDSFSNNLRDAIEENTVRIGLNYQPRPASTLLMSSAYQELELDRQDIVRYDQIAKSVELQYIYRAKGYHLISGAGYFNEDVEKDEVPSYLPDAEYDIDHRNIYTYFNLNYFSTAFLIGASIDFFKDEEFDLSEEQFNPKLGFTWEMDHGTTLRAAAFRILKRSLLGNQTLEPTQVAGFNQFFDDGTATDAWRYGVGLDQKLTDLLFGGVEYSQRDLKVFGLVFEDFPPPVVRQRDWDEKLGRLYLYWTPHPYLTIAPEYQYEKIETAEDFWFLGNVLNLETHRITLGLNFSHPCGFILGFKPAYVDQSGDFMLGGPFAPPVPDGERFWVVDGTIGYRLPKRRGIVSLEAKNLFDAQFKFQDSAPFNPDLVPEQLILLKLTLSL